MNGRRNWLVRIGAVPGALALLATALVGCAPARSAHGANTRAPVGGGTATAQGAPAAHGGAAGSASARASASTGTTRAATRTPTASRRTTKPSFPTASRPSASSALAALDRLTVAPSAPLAGYSRAAFGSAWTDNNNS
ncbi:MAG: hypothetical protein FWD74_07700, partial [Actinomycetia bacterium]|nr:hypothetical protein [Actinomycetes bacterium]